MPVLALDVIFQGLSIAPVRPCKSLQGLARQYISFSSVGYIFSGFRFLSTPTGRLSKNNKIQEQLYKTNKKIVRMGGASAAPPWLLWFNWLRPWISLWALRSTPLYSCCCILLFPRAPASAPKAPMPRGEGQGAEPQFLDLWLPYGPQKVQKCILRW